jgi:poly(A) polymerase
MKNLFEQLKKVPFEVYLASVSALHVYFGNSYPSKLYGIALTNLVEIAKNFQVVDYPGLEDVDAIVTLDDTQLFIRCIDALPEYPLYTFTVENLLYSIYEDKFLDRFSVYPDLRTTELSFAREYYPSAWKPIMDAALLISQFDYEPPESLPVPSSGYPHIDTGEQRELLLSIVTSDYPAKGLRLLFRSGFIEAYWPELFEMKKILHSKDHHPEGDVWEHTLETFRYRKNRDTVLSLALLMHDIGKQRAYRSNGCQFNKHAQIGKNISIRFLRRLGFDEELIQNVAFLVKEHMLPGYLADLPYSRTEEVMSSPLFPLVLELYRCDISSTYRKPVEYYRACKVYRKFLKHQQNPFRSIDGKKLVRQYL